MIFTVLTLFPEMFQSLHQSVIGNALKAGVIEMRLVNYRDYAVSKHKNVDDTPYGGGGGMILKPEPLFEAVRALPPLGTDNVFARRILLLSPQGRRFEQADAKRFAQQEELVLICGHYEGFDERIRGLADEEVSIGDYVLSGGELAAMVLIDAIARQVPGVLGNKESAASDSWSAPGAALEYPQYTRPAVFEGMAVPEVLLSGHHAQITLWRRKEALRRTYLRRPDLFKTLVFTPADFVLLEELELEYPELAAERTRWQHLRPKAKRRKKKGTLS